MKISNNKGQIFILAYDQGMEIGPSCLNSWSADIYNIFKLAQDFNFTGIALQKGIAEHYSNKYKLNSVLNFSPTPLILKMNGKSKVSVTNDISLAQTTIENAVKVGAAAIGYTIYWGSDFEADMVKEAGMLQEAAKLANLQFVLWSYPSHKELDEISNSTKHTAYYARLGLELGADVIKIKFPHFTTDLSIADQLAILQEIVQIAAPSKVVFAGGVEQPEDNFLQKCELIKNAGAAGMAVGRNIWGSKTPYETAKKFFEVWK